MPFPFDQLLTPKTADEELEELLSIAASQDLATTSWEEGNPLLALLSICAEVFKDFSQTTVEITRGGFGDTLSSDEWGDIWAASMFDEVRVPAEPATTDTFRMINADLVAHDFDPGEIIVAHAVTHKTYRNTQAVHLDATSTTDDIAISADEVGVDSNAAPGTITVLVAPSLPGVTCTNVESALGADEETTPRLVQRSRSKLGSLSPNGPKEAYSYVAQTPAILARLIAPNVLGTPITRVKTIASETTGILRAILATAAGAPSGPDVDIVQRGFDRFAEPWCTTAIAEPAIEVIRAVTYTAWVLGSNLTDAEIKLAIEKALIAWFKELAIGGYEIPPDTGAVYADAIEQVIGRAVPGVLRVQVSGGDTILDDDEVAVLGTISATIISLS